MIHPKLAGEADSVIPVVLILKDGRFRRWWRAAEAGQCIAGAESMRSCLESLLYEAMKVKAKL